MKQFSYVMFSDNVVQPLIVLIYPKVKEVHIIHIKNQPQKNLKYNIIETAYLIGYNYSFDNTQRTKTPD